MKYSLVLIVWVVFGCYAFIPSVFPQGFGEYGGAVGGAKQRQGSASSKGYGSAKPQSKRKVGSQGVGDLGVQPLRNQLMVISNGASLYPRQDDEAAKIEELSKDAILTPMVQSTSGVTEWFMVKTTKGTIGWVKAVDVRERPTKK